MMDYFAAHQFRLSANLHGGSEVMNYPWDSFTSNQNPHPAADWWREVCQRFVDTARTYGSNHFNDVTSSGYIAGGDFTITSGGDAIKANNSDEVGKGTILIDGGTLALSAGDHYIGEIHSLPDNVGLRSTETGNIAIYPNPTTDQVTVTGLPEGSLIELYNAYGRLVISSFNSQFSILNLKPGLYLLRTTVGTAKVIKR